MIQHIHKAIIDQMTADTSLEVEHKHWNGTLLPTWVTSSLEEVIKHLDYTFRIKPIQHPNDKFREAFESREPVWTRACFWPEKSWLLLVESSHWDFKDPNWTYSLTDPNPVDPYAHLRKANDEGKLACMQKDGEWVLPEQVDKKRWEFDAPPEEYKIAEPDSIVRIYHDVYFLPCGARKSITTEYTLSGLTGLITSRVVG